LKALRDCRFGVVALLCLICIALGMILSSSFSAGSLAEILVLVILGTACVWRAKCCRKINEQKLAFQELEEAKRRIQEYADQIGQAHEEERKRIARELHDDTVQTMVVISRRLDTILDGNSSLSIEMCNEMERLQADIREAQSRMRDFIQDLRPPTLEYLGLIPALRELVTQTGERSGIAMDFKLVGAEYPLAQEKRLLLYRIVQESLRNVCKHSKASECHVRAQFVPHAATIAVTDNGKGFMYEQVSRMLNTKKLGLMGMKERARLLGGTVDIISRPSQGTVVAVVLPNDSTAITEKDASTQDSPLTEKDRSLACM